MRFALNVIKLGVAGAFLLNTTLAAVPTAAQTVSVADIKTVNATAFVHESTVSEEAKIPPAVHTPAPDAVSSPPTSLAELVAAHMDADARDDSSKCLAVAVYFEAKGEPLVGQLAVAQVMLNRTISGRFPETICGVMRQPGQFSFVHGGAFPHIAENSHAWRTAVAIAHIAQHAMWHPLVGRAVFFHAKRVSPRWHATEVAALGNHIFYR